MESTAEGFVKGSAIGCCAGRKRILAAFLGHALTCNPFVSGPGMLLTFGHLDSPEREPSCLRAVKSSIFETSLDDL
jgi:hypothetical protein